MKQTMPVVVVTEMSGQVLKAGIGTYVELVIIGFRGRRESCANERSILREISHAEGFLCGLDRGSY